MTASDGPAALPELQAAYLEAMVHGSGRSADGVVEAALDERVTPQQIYLDIFQPTAYELGRLWQCNRISVAQEHLATAIIERQMGELHPLFKPRGEQGRTLVIGCVPGEWHRVGSRMVADFFEAAGWEVHYLGASVPIPAMVGLVRETHADLVGLSAQMLFSLPQVGEFARALHAAGLADIPVIAGGMPFANQPEIAGALNVIGCGGDAAAALRLAAGLFDRDLAPAQPGLELAASLALGRARELLVAITVARCMAAEGGGDEATTLQIRAGMEFVTRMLQAALAVGRPELMDAQGAWVAERQPHDGVPPELMLARLSCYCAVLEGLLPPPEGPLAARYVGRLAEALRLAAELR